MMIRLLALAALLFAPPAHAVVTIDWVTVGDPGNACDTQSQGCFGSVAKSYRISKFEVTNAQYTEFLNAMAATDTNGLYYIGMGSGFGGITQSGSSPSFSYSVIAGFDDLPVNFVSFWSATRFANWLHNGQPTGLQGNTTTEDGAYTLTPTGITNNTITRNAAATIYVTSQDEWYKAAYYKAGAMIYYDYPAGSDTLMTCPVPGPVANTANCLGPDDVGDPTEVGSYTGSASPNGTFDQGGNLWEWNEAVIGVSSRGKRGGSFKQFPALIAASVRSNDLPSVEANNLGFRVASTIAPVPSLSPAGILVLAAGLLGIFGLYRRR